MIFRRPIKIERVLILSFSLLILIQCTSKKNDEIITTMATPAFNFPTDSTLIKNWITEENEDSLYRHTWQIWDMINTKTSLVQEGDTLRRWMLWLQPAEIQQFSTPKEQRLIALEKPKQFHGKALADLHPGFYVSVHYNAAAADFAYYNKYLSDITLQNLLDSGQTGINEFPNASIAIKPAFYIVSQDDRYARIPVWHGPPAEPSPYAPNDWNTYAYIDMNNTAPENISLCDSLQPGPPNNCTYNLSDFISYRLTAEEVKLVEGEGNKNIREGDYAVLVGMHLTTKEIKRWTWQSFFWTPTPNTPAFPSSYEIARNGTFIQDKAVAHYAATVAYQMIKPVQPYTGGSISGEPVYAYNPYLEAPFDFGPDQPLRLNGYVRSSTGLIDNKFGVQTNCMSCHATAHYYKTDTIDNLFYISDTYVDMQFGKIVTNPLGSPQDSLLFIGKLKTDFLWSIPDTANDDTN